MFCPQQVRPAVRHTARRALALKITGLIATHNLA
jgi:hypothetical protein